MDKHALLQRRHAVLVAWRQAIQAAYRMGEAPPERGRKTCQRAWDRFQTEIAAQQRAASQRKTRLEGERGALLSRAIEGKKGAAHLNAQNKGLLLAIETAQREIDALAPLSTPQATLPLEVWSGKPLSAYPGIYRQASGTLWERLTMADKMSIAVAVLAAAMGVLSVFLYHDFGQSPRFTIDAPSGPAQRAVIHCTNPYSTPLVFHVPWPPTGPTREEQTAGHVGIEIYAATRESATARRWESPPEAWTYEGHSLAQRGPIEIAPGITIPVFFDVSQLEAEKNGIAALEVRCTNGNGRTLATNTFSLR
ncbi:MAG: hypothetical protein HYV27_02700 [Candidatus Hydrogenedentes bacterium]|nr:hypothetical protein [Candidatus Hydrogenedentota bacterium]